MVTHRDGLDDLERGPPGRAMPFALVITDPNLPDNPIVYVNKAFEEVTLYTAEYAIGQNCRFLQGERTEDDQVAAIRDAIERREDVSVDITNYRADGETFRNRLLVVPLFDAEGGVANFLGIQRMLPEAAPPPEADPDQRRAEAVAEEATRASKTDRGGRRVPGIDAIRSGVEEHISMIVGLVRLEGGDDLRSVAPRNLGRRIECLQLLYEEFDRAGVVSVADELVPVGAYLSRVAATLTHLEGRRSVRVNVDCDMAQLPVRTAARLGLLLTELLLNAFRHAFPDRPEGLVNVEFKLLTRDRARLIVKDDGSGMGAEDDWPFTRDERAEEAEEERTGHRVGAKLVRQLVDTLDAHIDVNSDDFGTTVEVGFRLDDVEVEARARERAE